MKIKSLLFVLLASFLSNAQVVKDSITSKKLLQTRQITISLPASFEKESNKTYPLVLVLDGEYLFDPFNGALSYGNYWDDLPEVILVGINQNNQLKKDCFINEETGLPEDKGAAFFEFIGSELLPYLQEKYRLAPFKVIAGHNLSATYLNLFLYKENPIFNGYICLNPELASEMDTRIPNRFQELKQNIFYYLSTSEEDVLNNKESLIKLDGSIKAVGSKTLNYKFDEFPESTNYSLVLYSIPSALYQFFGAFQPITLIEYEKNIATLPSGYVDYLKNKYDAIEKTMGYKVPLRYNDCKAIEAAIIKNNAFKEFEILSQYCSKKSPKTMLAPYYMGLFYEKNEDFKNASKKYMEAYTMGAVGDLDKEFMLDKVDSVKGKDKK